MGKLLLKSNSNSYSYFLMRNLWCVSYFVFFSLHRFGPKSNFAPVYVVTLLNLKSQQQTVSLPRNTPNHYLSFHRATNLEVWTAEGGMIVFRLFSSSAVQCEPMRTEDIFCAAHVMTIAPPVCDERRWWW